MRPCDVCEKYVCADLLFGRIRCEDLLRYTCEMDGQ